MTGARPAPLFQSALARLPYEVQRGARGFVAPVQPNPRAEGGREVARVQHLLHRARGDDGGVLGGYRGALVRSLGVRRGGNRREYVYMGTAKRKMVRIVLHTTLPPNRRVGTTTKL